MHACKLCQSHQEHDKWLSKPWAEDVSCHDDPPEVSCSLHNAARTGQVMFMNYTKLPNW